MLEVKGFRGYRFAEERTGTLDRVVTPPYDVIDPAERRRLAGLSPHNMAHLILPQEEAGKTPYESAACKLEEWIACGVIERDEAESFYVMEQSFRGLDGKDLVRRGFVGIVKLPEEGESDVLGHESTFDRTVDDRLRLMEATRANLSPVFVLYADIENRLDAFLGQVAGRPEDATARTSDGATSRLWRVPYEESVTEFFRDKRLYVADGHHRFHTACAYRDLMRAQERPNGPRPYDYMLIGLVSLQDPGLQIYPTHRLMPAPEGFDAPAFFSKLEQWFEVTSVAGGLGAMLEAEDGCAIGFASREGRCLLRLRDIVRGEVLGADHGPAWRDLDVAVLHRLVIERALGIRRGTEFVYEKDAEQALAAVERGEHGLAFLLKATRAGQIRACAEAGESMPHKSTYFYPKLPSGMVLYRVV